MTAAAHPGGPRPGRLPTTIARATPVTAHRPGASRPAARSGARTGTIRPAERIPAPAGHRPARTRSRPGRRPPCPNGSGSPPGTSIACTGRRAGALWRGAAARSDDDYETLARYAPWPQRGTSSPSRRSTDRAPPPSRLSSPGLCALLLRAATTLALRRHLQRVRGTQGGGSTEWKSGTTMRSARIGRSLPAPVGCRSHGPAERAKAFACSTSISSRDALPRA